MVCDFVGSNIFEGKIAVCVVYVDETKFFWCYPVFFQSWPQLIFYRFKYVPIVIAALMIVLYTMSITMLKLLSSLSLSSSNMSSHLQCPRWHEEGGIVVFFLSFFESVFHIFNRDDLWYRWLQCSGFFYLLKYGFWSIVFRDAVEICNSL